MEGGLEKIQTLEDSLFRTRDERSTETRGQAPVFTVPLSNIDSLREGENAHFEARLTPINDPNLTVSTFCCFRQSCYLLCSVFYGAEVDT